VGGGQDLQPVLGDRFGDQDAGHAASLVANALARPMLGGEVPGGEVPDGEVQDGEVSLQHGEQSLAETSLGAWGDGISHGAGDTIRRDGHGAVSLHW
jgi:hypothetical protein